MEHLFLKFDAAVNFLTAPQYLFPLSVLLLVATLKFAHVWTRPPIALALGGLLVLLGLYSWFDWPGVSHQSFRDSLSKPDNVPIVLILGSLAFFTWLSLRKGTLNDERIARSLPPMEAAEKSRKVLVWPDLVYTELIAMVICTVLLIVWSLLLKAPIEEPANTARTPNPSKAPWYFLGLQEMVSYSAFWGGVGIPTVFVGLLLLLPYLDRGSLGTGVWFSRHRILSISLFTTLLVVNLVLIVIGTFFRGPNWALVTPW